VTVDRCLDRYANAGLDAAVEVLEEFYDTTGPVEAKHLQTALEERLPAEAFAQIGERLKRSSRFRAYQKRIIFG
jgi:hypothetical protein